MMTVILIACLKTMMIGKMHDSTVRSIFYHIKNSSNDFKIDQFHYHRLLFQFDEKFDKVHETKHAILFEVEEGRFWVPKSLIKTKTYIKNSVLMVHKMFERNYIKSDSLKFDK
jgi:chromosome condensin MukBEF MukE localization factor